MKRQIILLIAIALVFSSCNREVNQFLGDYSFKISGEVAITNAEGEVTHRLMSKSGQMNILKEADGEDAHRVLITMNEMGGSGYTIHGTISDNRITFEPYTFSTNLITEENVSLFGDNTSSLVCQISASGSGILNGNMLVIDEQWSGHQSGNADITIQAPKITIIAEKN